MAKGSCQEIESKFRPRENTESKLKELGATRVGKDEEFRDVYYDTSDFRLASSDYWLRCREDSWQLKFPPSVSAKMNPQESFTQYMELDTEKKIFSQLQEVLSEFAEREWPGSMHFEDVLKPFAEFTTYRKKYHVTTASHQVAIVLDQTDFGYSLGEIEILLSNNGSESSEATADDQVTRAVKEINRIKMLIGDQSEGKVHSKLVVNLKEKKPGLCATFEELGVTKFL